MGALHIIGEDLQLGLGIGGGTARQQQRLEALLGIGLLRLAGNGDLAQIAAHGAPAEHGADGLLADRVGAEMADMGDDFERLFAAADNGAAKRQPRALMQRDVERETAIATAMVEQREVGLGAFVERDPVKLGGNALLVHRLLDQAGQAAAGGDADRHLLIAPTAAIDPLIKVDRGAGQLAGHQRPVRPQAFEGLEVGVAPRLLPAGRKRGHAAASVMLARPASAAMRA